jgi:hypothetical protein
MSWFGNGLITVLSSNVCRGQACVQGTEYMSLRRVNLTVIVVLGYFVRFKRFGEGFNTFGKLRIYITSYLVKYECVLLAT